MRRFIISLALVLALTSNALAYEGFDIFEKETKELTLEEATKYMLEESSGIKEAKLNKKRATGSIKSSTETIDSLDRAEEYYDKTGLIADYDGLNKAIVKLKKEFVSKQKNDNYNAEVNNLKYGLREKYFMTLQAKDAYEIQKEGLDIADASLKEFEKKFELGLVKALDLEQAKLAKEAAELAVLETEKNLNLAKMDLNNYMGYGMYTNLVLLDKLEEVELSKKSIADTSKEALENNNQIKYLKYMKKLSKRRMEGLKLRVSMTSSSYINVEADYQASEKGLADIVIGLELDANNKYMTMMVNKHAVDLAKKEVDYAVKQRDAAKLAYELGVGVFLDLKKANANLEAKKLDLSNKILKYNISVDDYELLSTVGRKAVSIN